jgi:hypothetical protein
VHAGSRREVTRPHPVVVTVACRAAGPADGHRG